MAVGDLYNGNSEGFQHITEGYVDYSKEVIARRAIPDLRDGLKPVQRRIIYSAHKAKITSLQKCAVIVGEALKLHPHGDAALYGAMTLLTDNNGSWNMPVFRGMGNLGFVNSSKPAAAMRYPKACLNENAADYFKEESVMDLVPAEEGEGLEPVTLLPSYPTVLVNGTSGIAVSVGTRIPSFNFGDVCDLTIKYLENGELQINDIIYPDFPTGGVLVKTDSEVAKIMATGVGKLKVRAKVEIEGKEIIVKEVPFGRTIESVVKAIEDAEMREISSVMDLTDRNSEGTIVITCKSKRIVESVLLELYRRGILQTTFASSILVTYDGKPYIYGVHDIIKNWVEWRKAVLRKKFAQELKNIDAELITLSYFIRLINNKEWNTNYTSLVRDKGKKAGDEYLKQIFEDIPYDTCTWISGRALSAFNNGGAYANRYADLQDTANYYKNAMENTDEYIIDELKKLKKSKAGKYDRKTEISNTDYRFSKITDSDVIEDSSACVYTLFKSGYFKKTRDPIYEEGILCQFRGQANSPLVGFDNFGRVVRLSATEFEFTSPEDNGVYLPKFFGAAFQEDYRVLYMGILDGTTRMLVYRDGYIGFLDTKDWVGKKLVRFTNAGVCTAVMDQLLHVYEEDEIPKVLMLADDTGKHVKMGVLYTDDIPVRSRTSRAKVFNGTGICTKQLRGFDYMKAIAYCRNMDKYVNKLKVLDFNDLADGGDGFEEGIYLDICKNIEVVEK